MQFHLNSRRSYDLICYRQILLRFNLQTLKLQLYKLEIRCYFVNVMFINQVLLILILERYDCHKKFSEFLNVSNMRDKDGLSYARKPMIRCGLALDVNGTWRVEQVFPHLEEIIRKYTNHCNGEPLQRLEKNLYSAFLK